MTADVVVNGESTPFAEPTTVAELVARTLAKPDGSFDQRGIAVAVNEEVLPRREWEDTELRAGDRVEIITAVQGG